MQDNDNVIDYGKFKPYWKTQTELCGEMGFSTTIGGLVFFCIPNLDGYTREDLQKAGGILLAAGIIILLFCAYLHHRSSVIDKEAKALLQQKPKPPSGSPEEFCLITKRQAAAASSFIGSVICLSLYGTGLPPTDYSNPNYWSQLQSALTDVKVIFADIFLVTSLISIAAFIYYRCQISPTREVVIEKLKEADDNIIFPPA